MTKEVDPKSEMSSLVCEAAPQKAIFFEKLKGYPGWRGCGSLMGNRERLALVFAVQPAEVLPHYAKMLNGEPGTYQVHIR